MGKTDKEVSSEAVEETAAQENEILEESEAAETAEEEAAAENSEIKDPEERKNEEALAELKDKYTRLYAEFDNFRKRTEKEKAQMFDFGAKNVIEKLLPVADNFERALGTVEDEDKEDAFTKGVEGIFKQLQKVFEDLDVRAIEAVGQKFDPNLHNAVMTETEGDAEEDTVTQDLQKGYTYKGQVVRHSMVKVKK